MRAFKRAFFGTVLISWTASALWGATFGTVVQIGGHVSDIALDESRNVAYIANYTANRIEVLNRATNTLQNPIRVPHQPAAIALSPDSRYLVIVHYTLPTERPSVTIRDLANGTNQNLAIDPAPLAVAFGNSSRALITTTGGFKWLDPVTGAFLNLPPPDPSPDAQPLPVPFATFPPEIIKASAGVSGDGNVIYVLADVVAGEPSEKSLLTSYNVSTGAFHFLAASSDPNLGPRLVSVDKDGSNLLAGWALLTSLQRGAVLMAQFPAASGSFNLGGHAFDSHRGLIYGHIPTGAAGSGSSATQSTSEAPVLTVFDADNLTVRERFHLKESLAGKSLLSADGQTLYSASDSGVTIFPIGSLAQQHRVTASVEDLLFTASGCERNVVSQQFDIVDPGGGQTDFTLSTSSPGVRLSPSSGTTPAHVTVSVDLALFQNQKGTVAIPINIASAAAINLPAPVRVLVNSREPNQRGTLVNVPGKLVDLLADPARNRFYVVRQDKNLVLVFDGSSYQQIAALRTGNTPTQMAMTLDRRYLLVGNNNSQIASVFDLETLQPDRPIVFPVGHYPRSIAVSAADTVGVSRVAGDPNKAQCEAWKQPLPDTEGRIDIVDFATRTATTPCTLGIYENGMPAHTVLTATESGSKILAAMNDGNVLLYEASADAFVASRKDFPSLSGAYLAVSDTILLVDNHLLNSSLVHTGNLETDSGSSSGAVFIDGLAIRTTATGTANPGTITKLDAAGSAYVRPIRTVESPLRQSDLLTPQDGQIGQMISPFTRTLSALSNRQSFISLSISGLTVLPWAYDDVPPTPSIHRVVNSADFTPAVAPGGLISVMGGNMSSSRFGAGGFPLPTVLGEACLTVNDKLVPLLAVTPGQINGQLPFDVVGQGTMVLRTAGGISSPFSFQISTTAPAVFHNGVAGPRTEMPTIFRATNSELVSLSNPVHPKDYLVIYATGLGAVSGDVMAGDAAPYDPLAFVTTPPTVMLGSMELPVLYAGLVPGQAGVYQINAGVPWNAPEGMEIPLTILQGGYSFTLNVRVVH